MKLKDGIIITPANGEFVLVDSGIDGIRFNGMIKLNSTAAFIVEQLKEETDIETLIKILCKQYSIDEKTANTSVEKTINQLLPTGVLIND